MLFGAVCFVSALHAAAAVHGAQPSKCRSTAFLVFVALVANAAVLVATVCIGWAIMVAVAGLKAVTRERVTAEAVAAIARGQTSDAAVQFGSTMSEPWLQAVAVGGALIALAVDAPQIGRAGGAGATVAGSRCACGGGDLTQRYACTARVWSRTPHAASRPRHVERESPATAEQRTAQSHAREQASEQRGSYGFHGATVSARASLAAKPCG